VTKQPCLPLRAPKARREHPSHTLRKESHILTLDISKPKPHHPPPASIKPQHTHRVLICSQTKRPCPQARPVQTSRPAITIYQPVRETLASSTLMCIEHTAECPVCGKEYLVYVEFCRDLQPPLLACPNGTANDIVDMGEGSCPSPVCPNSLTGGCVVS